MAIELTISKQFFCETSIMFNLSSKFQGQITSKKGRKDWWLFRATDFQSLMYPCFTFCRILGIFPYKINDSSFEISKPCYFLSTTVTCVFCFCLLTVIVDIIEWYNLYNVHRLIQFYTFYIFGSFITLVTYVLSSLRMRSLQTVLENSLTLSSKTYQKQSMLIHFKDIFGFSLLSMHALICYYDIPLPILHKMFSTYVSLVMFQMDMLYVNCVCVLKACFKKINDDLANILVRNDKSHLVKWVNREQKNPLLLMELKALKKQHLMISDSVQMLNKTFSPQLVTTIILMFIQITLEMYFDIVHWHNGLSIVFIKQFHHKFALFYILYYTIKLVLMAWVCEISKNEAVKISTTVHDVLNSTSDKLIKREVLKF